MTTDTRLAFEHPEARAAATEGEGPFDRISLRDHVVEAEIGAFQAERGVSQRISFNIVVELVPLSGPIDDDVDRILSYDRLTEAIRIELDAERLNLLETLAERIAERILSEPRAFRVFVRVEKLDRGPGALGVEIVRSADQRQSAVAVDAPVPHPLVIYLPNALIGSPKLADFVDGLVAEGRPVILTVGYPDAPRPHADHVMAQRRIDLLAIEQNAWALAARDPRCVVRHSRTELDWAMKQGQISVWAPSKIVLDAVHGPNGGPVDLVAWFAAQMGAHSIRIVGDDRPASSDVPVTHLPLGDVL